MIKERISEICEALEINYTELAVKLDTDRQTMYRIRSGEQSLLRYVDKFVELGVNLHWLFTGKGDMFFRDIQSSFDYEPLSLIYYDDTFDSIHPQVKSSRDDASFDELKNFILNTSFFLGQSIIQNDINITSIAILKLKFKNSSEGNKDITVFTVSLSEIQYFNSKNDQFKNIPVFYESEVGIVDIQSNNTAFFKSRFNPKGKEIDVKDIYFIVCEMNTNLSPLLKYPL